MEHLKVTPEPDALVPWLQPNTDAMKEIVEELLHSDGYVVIPGVLSGEEADAELNRLWGFVEKVSPSVDRNKPASWYPVDGSEDPWPHTQKDRFQLYQAGWLFNGLRETLAARVFEPLYGTRELHCSKDGFTFHRPTGPIVDADGSSFTPPPFMKGPRHQGTCDEHFDQGAAVRGLQCIQGSVALLDQGVGDGCFLCWPRSQRQHASMMDAREAQAKAGSSAAKFGGSQYYVPLTKHELAGLARGEFGGACCAARRVAVRKGDVVLWRSDLVHAGGAPVGPRKSKDAGDGSSNSAVGTGNFRAVVYVCMAPACLTPEAVYGEKREAYASMASAGHWPGREDWFEARDRPRRAAYWTSPPPLSARQAELYGLVRYRACDHADAEKSDECGTLGLEISQLLTD
jgi:hypothetical protein